MMNNTAIISDRRIDIDGTNKEMKGPRLEGVGSVRKMLGAEKREQRGRSTGTRYDEKPSRATKGRGAVNELHYYTRKSCDESRGWKRGKDT